MPRGVTLGPRFRDGLGVRVVEVDKASGDTVEVLQVCLELCAFEKTIKERTSRLSNFRHPRFAPVRGVGTVSSPNSRLGVISDHIVGPRLSEILETARTHSVAIDTNVALHLIRELLSAISVLHGSRNVTHGAIAPERLIITPRGRLVIVDYTLGLALERLECKRGRLWRDFHIAVPPTAGPARFDQGTDIVQIGTLAVALLLGRQLDVSDYTDGLKSLLDAVGETTVNGDRKPLSAPLRSWLERALPLETRKPFATAQQANVALEQVVIKERRLGVAPAALKAFISRHLAQAGADAVKAEEAQADRTAPSPIHVLVPKEPVASDGSLPELAASGSAPRPPVPPARATDQQNVAVAPPEDIRRDETLVAGAVFEAAPQVEQETPAGALLEIVPEVVPGPALEFPSGVGSEMSLEIASGTDSEITLEFASATFPATPVASEIDGEAVSEIMVDLALETGSVPEIGLATVPETDSGAAAELASGGVPGIASGILSDIGPAIAPEPEISVAAVPGIGTAMTQEAATAVEPPSPPTDLPGITGFAADPLRTLALEEEPGIAPAEIAPPPDAGITAPGLSIVDEPTPLESPSVGPPPERWDEAARGRPCEPALEPASDEIWVIDPSELSLDAALLNTPHLVPIVALGSPVPESAGAIDRAPALEHSPPTDQPSAEPVTPLTGPAAVTGTATDRPPVTALEDERGVPPLEVGAASLSVVDEVASPEPVQAERPSERRVEATFELQHDLGPEVASEDVWVIDPSDLSIESALLNGQPLAPDVSPGPLVPGPAGEAGTTDEAVESEEVLVADAVEQAGAAQPAPAAGPEAAAPLEPLPILDFKPSEVVAPGAPAETTALSVVEEPALSAQAASEAVAAQVPVAEPAAPVVEPSGIQQAVEVFERLLESLEDAKAEAPADTSVQAAGTDEVFRLAEAPIAAQPPPDLPVAVTAARHAEPAKSHPRAEAVGVRLAPDSAVPAAGIEFTEEPPPAAELEVLDILSWPAEPLAPVQSSEAILPAEAAVVVEAAGAVPVRPEVPAAASEPEPSQALGPASPSPPIVVEAQRPEAEPPTESNAGVALPLFALPIVVAAADDAPPMLDTGSAPAATAAAPEVGQVPPRGLDPASPGGSVVAFEPAPIRSRPAVFIPAGEASDGPPPGRVLAFSVRAKAAKLARTVPRRLIELGSTRLRWRQTVAAALILVALGGVRLATAYWFKTPPPTGGLLVETAPDGLDIYIDNTLRGRTPMRLTLLAGDHALEVRGRGLTRTLPVRIASGVQAVERLSWPLSVRTGSVRVDSEPSGATVSIDGQSRGVTPLTIRDLPARVHTLVVQGRGGRVEQAVAIEPERTTTVKVPVFPGWMAVFSPFDLQIFEGGRLLGTTEVERIMLRAGRHVIEFVNEDLGYRLVRPVNITPGALTPVSIELPNGTLQIDAPPGWEVWLDGDRLGETPLAPLEVSLGTHEVRLKHPQAGERRHVVVVTQREPARVTAEGLTPKA